jgi:AcrR family transcriptional regulator
MSEPKRRGAAPRSRRAKAEQTRMRIVDAAHHVFLEQGYHGATVAAIAKRAGVATQTVYFVFHNKPALISAAIDAAVMGPDAVPPDETDWWAAMQSALTGHQALGHFVRGAGPLYGRAAAISEVLRAAAMADPECREIWEHHDGMQVAAFRQVIEVVAAKSPLRRGLDTATATDVLITVFGDSTYQLLTEERGWSDAQTVAWMADALPLLLLEGTRA